MHIHVPINLLNYSDRKYLFNRFLYIINIRVLYIGIRVCSFTPEERIVFHPLTFLRFQVVSS